MIFVVAEHKDARLKPITFELLVFAQRLSRDFGQPVTAVVLGSSTGPLVDELKSKKIDRVMVAEHPELAEYSPDSYVAILKSVLEESAQKAEDRPFVVLAGHTTQGMDFAP